MNWKPCKNLSNYKAGNNIFTCMHVIGTSIHTYMYDTSRYGWSNCEPKKYEIYVQECLWYNSKINSKIYIYLWLYEQCGYQTV